MKLLPIWLSMLKTSFVFSLAMFFTLTILMLTTVAAQDAENIDNIIIRHNLPDFVPLKAELMGLDSVDILSNLKVKITNTSQKPIYHFRFGLRTVDVSVGGAPLEIWSIEYGRHELGGGANESEENNVRSTDKPINPNETINFKIRKNSVRVHKINIKNGLYPQPRIYEFVFVDLTFGDRSGFTRSGTFTNLKQH